MNLIELNRALRQLRLGGMAAVLETRLLQAQSDAMAPIDLISCLVSDELSCRSERLLERRRKQAQFRDSDKRLDNFDFQFNVKMNRNLVGPPGRGNDHRRSGHAQTAANRGRGTAGGHRAPLRRPQYLDHLKSSGGRLGQAVGRQRGSLSDA